MLTHVIGLDAASWAVLAVAAALVGISKTALPGAGTLSVALFAAVLPARASTGALLVLLIVGDLLALRVYRHHADWGVLRRLVPTVILGVLAGVAFLAIAGDTVVRRAIGVVLLVLVAVTVARRAGAAPGARARPGRRVGSVYGVLGGFTTMVANAGGPVMSLYFLALRLEVTAFLGTAAWFFFVVNVSKVPFSVGLGLITGESLLMDAALVPAVLLGAVAGRALARRIAQALFERVVLVLTVVSALYLLV